MRSSFIIKALLLSFICGLCVSVFSNSVYNYDYSITTSLKGVKKAFSPSDITALYTGGSIISTNGRIQSGSQLNYTFSNGSSESVILTSIKLVDGVSGSESSNLLSDNVTVVGGTSISYTITVGAIGVQSPIARFTYKYNNTSYSVEAKYTDFDDINKCVLSITSSGNGSVLYNGNSTRNTTNTYSVNRLSSITISFKPDDGYKIKKVTINNTDVTSKLSNNSYTISLIMTNQTVNVEFEKITYNLSITATGNGSVLYNNTTIRSKTSSFTMNKGESATISFNPDAGNKIKSVKVNGTSVTVSNNKYKISNISSNTTVNVEFEAITHTLSIKASGNGSVSYNNETIRSKTSTFTIKEGESVTISFNPDAGNRIKSVIVNNTSVNVSNNKYTISNISKNTTIEVEFEAIIYDFSITASGNGTVSYNNATIRNQTNSYTIKGGPTVTITISPDSGCRIKRTQLNGKDVEVSNNLFTIDNVSEDITIGVEFEETPTYSITITSSGGGSVNYKNQEKTIYNSTEQFTEYEGTSVCIELTPDFGCKIKSLMINKKDNSADIVSGQYSILVKENLTVNAEFAEELKDFTSEGVNYRVVSLSNRTVSVSQGNYGIMLVVHPSLEYKGEIWKVIDIDADALSNNKDLAAIIWEPQVAFTANVENPNLLLYVQAAEYAPSEIQNVVINEIASNIILTDAASGNNFYCPYEFTAQHISYTHNYIMSSGIGEARGWETISLPFDVQKITHETKGELIPFARWMNEDANKPFWLMELSGNGFVGAENIKANTPYIISMPNNEKYKDEFKMEGRVTFSGKNVVVRKSDDLSVASFSSRSFIPNYLNGEADATKYVLNVNNDYETNNSGIWEGSKFVQGLRVLHPFEAYMTTMANTRSFGIFDDMSTEIHSINMLTEKATKIKVYNLKGQLMQTFSKNNWEEKKAQLPAGIYIVNGQKIVKK